MTRQTKKSKSSKEPANEFLFDDCPICQAMKKAQERGFDLSYEELQQAFSEANKHPN
jgi:hypothetical protein